MKRLIIASIVLTMAGSAFAQSRMQPQTQTSDPDSDNDRNAKRRTCVEGIEAERGGRAKGYEGQRGHTEPRESSYANSTKVGAPCRCVI